MGSWLSCQISYHPPQGKGPKYYHVKPANAIKPVKVIKTMPSPVKAYSFENTKRAPTWQNPPKYTKVPDNEGRPPPTPPSTPPSGPPPPTPPSTAPSGPPLLTPPSRQSTLCELAAWNDDKRWHPDTMQNLVLRSTGNRFQRGVRPRRCCLQHFLHVPWPPNPL